MIFSFLLKNYSKVRKVNSLDYIGFNKNNEKVFLKVRKATNEINIPRTLIHPYILKYNRKFIIGEHNIIEYPFISNKKLNYHHKIYIKKVFLDIIEAILFLIDKDMVHCDLRPSNILIKGSNIIIIDFSHYKKKYRKINLNKSYYRAPEINKGIVHKYSDLYSVGMIFSYLILGRDLIKINYSSDSIFRNKILKLLKRKYGNDSAITLIEILLKSKSRNRKISLKTASRSIADSRILF